jgi:hypothetical protein
VPRSTASRPGCGSRLTNRATQKNAQLPIPSHSIPLRDLTGSAVRIRPRLSGRIEVAALACPRRCDRQSPSRSWSRGVGLSCIAAANRANRGPRNALSASTSSTPSWDDCVTRAGLLVSGRDRQIGIGAPGAGHALHPTPLAPRVAPTVLGASGSCAPEQQQPQVPVEALADIRGAPAVESAGHRCASTSPSFLP